LRHESVTIRDLGSNNKVAGVLQKGERGKLFSLALSRMSDAEVVAIRSALDQRIAGSRIETSSWIPGSDWSGTPYWPIYEKAAAMNEDISGRIFGLFVWEAFERHPLDWYTERFSMGGEEDRFRVYFRPGD
jgi:hypothetical protein